MGLLRVVTINFIVIFAFLQVTESMVVNASMPCCLESLGLSTCNRLMKKAPWFNKKCRTDADFAFIQCCHTCKTDMPKLGVELFSKDSRSEQCYDRRGHDFCARFVRNNDNPDGPTRCSGTSAAFAFRVCRRSCGFCESEIYLKKKIDEQCPLIG